MPRGDESFDTGQQQRQAKHKDEGYEHRAAPEDEAERRARATVNTETGGGCSQPQDHGPSRKPGYAHISEQIMSSIC